MKNSSILLLLYGWLALFAIGASAQNINCVSATSGGNTYKGSTRLNYGSLTNAYSIKGRTTAALGDVVIGSYFGQNYNGASGSFSRFLLPPFQPSVSATEGDLADRVQINWRLDPLSPSAEGGFNIYRDGAFIDHVEKGVELYVDFNVQAGLFYNYQVAGVNEFGEGIKGTSLGFLNPNGVVTGQVKTFNGNPVSDATITITPTLGASLAFSNGLAFADSTTLLPATAWTISCWVKIGDNSDKTGIFDFGVNAKRNAWMRTQSSGAKGIEFSVGDGNTAKNAVCTFATDPNGWHHIAGVYSGSSLLLYVDGTLVSSQPALVLTARMPILFGKAGNDPTVFFKGNLDEVRVFNRQLSQTEINQYKNRTVNSDAPGLAAYWKFDEGIGSKAFDRSSNHRTVYLCGAVWSTERPDVVNGAVSDESGFYRVEGINYGSGTTFTVTPAKKVFNNASLEFNAANQQYATLPDSILHDAQNTAAIELRVQNFENAPASRTLLSNQSADGSTTRFRLMIVNGDLRLTIGTEEKNFGQLGAGYQYLTINMEKNGASTNVGVYKNGLQLGLQSYLSLPIPLLYQQIWLVGARKPSTPGYDQYFSGLIDEVAFYDAKLTVAQMQLHAGAGIDVNNPQLRSYFPFNEGDGDVLEDFGQDRWGKGTVNGALWSTVTGISSGTFHEFLPNKRLLSLNPSNTSTDGVDFTDLSTVAVSGYVRFKETDCFEEGVEILINGQSADPKIFTDADGKFVIDFEPGTSAYIEPKFKDHDFSPAIWQVTNLSAPVAGILFRDHTKRKILVNVNGGLCKLGILGPTKTLTLKVASPGTNPCFSRTITLQEGETHALFSDLPPRELNVSVTASNNTDLYTYFQGLGGITADLREVSDTIDFNYVAAPKIELLTPLDTNACGDPMLQQLERYTLKFKVYQDYAGGKCYLDSAGFSFNNGLADTAPFDTVMTENKSLNYRFQAGMPNLAAPYLKSLTVTAKQANGQEVTQAYPAVVLGARPTGITFASTAPQIPFMILRDPPGDGSSATITQGITSCNNVVMTAAQADVIGGSIALALGTTTEIATGVGVAAITTVEIENTTTIGLSATLTETRENSMDLCVTTNQTLTTNADNNVIGRDADVFVGGALNFNFGVNKILVFDTLSCGYLIDQGIFAAPGITTTYYYQRYDIIHQVIPNLLLSGEASASADIARWLDILAFDDSLRSAAVFEENLSFSGGLTYEKSLTVDRTDTYTETFQTDIDATIANELGLTVNGTGVTVALNFDMTFSETKATAASVNNSTTVGYTLHDDDIGDLFSVTIKRDKRYGTPVFDLVSGESSCPWEAPTQKRNYVSLVADATAIGNVSSNAPAVFHLRMGNESESDEKRIYTLSIGSNPLGAIVKAEGLQLTAAGLEFEIPAGQSDSILLTIERGPLSYHYDDVEIILAASCESDTIEGFSKSLLLDVDFNEPCSEIHIAFPMQNDVIVANQNDRPITIDGYDENDPELQLVRIQYRSKFGDGSWINILPVAEIPKSVLQLPANAVSMTVPWNVTSLDDGPYELRAITTCSSGNQDGISAIVGLRVEREAPKLLGEPKPADNGVLLPGGEISITFNEEVNCQVIIQADVTKNNHVGLYNTLTGELIDAVISCSANKIIIVPNVPNWVIEGQTLRVKVDSIEDLAGNKSGHFQWEFFVNRSPLDHEDGNLNVTMYEGEEKNVLRQLVNTGGTIAVFEILGAPDFVNIYPNTGSLLPGEEVTITYKFPNTLPQGLYTDTIYFKNVQGNERVVIQARVLCAPPAWEFNAALYPSTMNFTVQLNIEGDLSKDREDIVAAFIDGELRGSARIQYLSALDTGKQYLAFLSVYGDIGDNGKPIDLEIWDASACLRFGEIVEQFTYQPDNVIGSLGNPTVLHTNSMVLREIPLNAGWNWISFNLAFPDPAVPAALASLLHPENDLIKGQSAYSEYFSGSWFGSLAALNNTKMFQFRADVPDTLKMTGALIDPATVSIPVSAGWNWIGYVPNYALPVNEALSALTPLNGDILKGQTAFAQYLAGTGWLGSLQFMEAPKGYQLKIGNAGTLVYPPSANVQNTVSANRDAPPPAFWQVDPAQFELSMTITGALVLDGVNTTTEQSELGVFAGDELRGSAQAVFIEPLNSYVFFLNVYANTTGEPLQFKLYDAATGQVRNISEQMYFSPDGHLGTIEVPQPFTLETSGTQEPVSIQYLDVQPNPFRDEANILFGAKAEQDVHLSVCDVQGRMVWQQNLRTKPGLNQVVWEARPEPGVYFIRLQTPDGVVTRKVVCQR